MPKTKVFEPTEVTLEPVLAIQVDQECGTDPGEIGGAMDAAFQTIVRFAGRHALQLAGPPRALYTDYGPDGVKFTVAMPVAPPPDEIHPDDGARVAEIPGGKALRFTHVGPYENLKATYDASTAWMKQAGLLESEADWANHLPMSEEYMNDPESTPPDQLLTYIYVPTA